MALSEAHGVPSDIACAWSVVIGLSYACLDHEPRRVPSSVVEVDGDNAQRLLKLLDALEDHDDVQSVSANFDMAEDVLEAIQA